MLNIGLETLRVCLSKAGKLDGLLFSLHGALLVEDDNDVDGSLLTAARSELGNDIPIVATLDLHAYITPAMIRYADVILAYHTSPHVDSFETGCRAARVLKRIFEGAMPVYGAVRLPMISIAEAQNTFGKLLSPIFQRLDELETRDDILGASVLMTQPWLDVPELGWSVVVVADGKDEMARSLAEELAEMAWNRREEIKVDYYGAEEAINRALTCSGKPVVIADGPDATNSGAGGDSTHLLRAMVDRRIPDGVLTIMVDPEAVAHAASVGPGAVFDLAVGGKRDHIFSKPLPVTGKVVSIQPARYVLHGHGGNNLPMDMGLSATIRINDVTLLLVERPGAGSTPMMYRCVGLEPKDFKIVVVKSPAGFRAEFEPFAAQIILTDCPLS